jgi:hypothetical protein
MRLSSVLFAHSRLPRRRRELSVQSWTAHRAPALARRGVLTEYQRAVRYPGGSIQCALYAALYRAPVLGERGERRAHGRQARGARLRSSATAALIRNGCAHPQRLRLSATAVLIRNGCAYPQRLRLPAAHVSRGQEYLVRPPARMHARALSAAQRQRRQGLSCGSPLCCCCVRYIVIKSVSGRFLCVPNVAHLGATASGRRWGPAGGVPDPMALGHRCRRCRRR